MPFQPSTNNLPRDVQEDISSGFVLTDVDDRYQRANQINESTWTYRSGTDDQHFLSQLTLAERQPIETVISEDIDINQLSDDEIDDAIQGYYDSLDAMKSEFNPDEVTMLIAECYFESEIDDIR